MLRLIFQSCQEKGPGLHSRSRAEKGVHQDDEDVLVKGFRFPTKLA